MSDIGTDAESVVNDAVNSAANGTASVMNDAANDAANVTDGPFVRYVRKARPNMREASILQGEHWRIGILTESLIRFEWSDSGEFEDNLTQMVVNRDLGADPQFTVSHRDGLLIVDTPALYVTYDGKPFSKEG